ncbi:retrovirus-related Pol polyprotein from transposon 412 [Nephila pilipes]|uniref:Retrovirus-related Pol polyprotein from transposon 412 n=1 Tax=Nephila pilipes TaxID=299642 RepID=A0A8X6NAF9_NEPPI|nr:retrovirus-related Pol polyprotein from transposon 412 [Nephila pilipes]
MLYGRRPICPLSILKDSGTEDIPVPIGQLKSVINYLNDLQIKLKLVAEQAGIAFSSNQMNYAYYHNCRKKYKSFDIGDKVIVLSPDSTHKMYVRWTSPCTIVEKQSAHSYVVQMPDNSVKHNHANKMRKLNIQTNNIGVIYKTDIDFGDIENTPVTKLTPTDETYIKVHMNSSHLNTDQKQAVIDLFVKNQAIITYTPKIARIGEHSSK